MSKLCFPAGSGRRCIQSPVKGQHPVWWWEERTKQDKILRKETDERVNRLNEIMLNSNGNNSKLKRGKINFLQRHRVSRMK